MICGKSELPLVSIVVQNYNGKKYLEKCLTSLLRTDYPVFEVIVVDDASTDGSADIVKRVFDSYPQVKVIQNTNRLGISVGRNIGIRAAKGKYVLFLDNDVEVDSEFLTKLVLVLESDKSIGVAQSKVLFMDRTKINSAGGFIDVYGRPYLRGCLKIDKGQFSKVSEVFFASGCAMIVSRRVLYEVGLFDPRFVF